MFRKNLAVISSLFYAVFLSDLLIHSGCTDVLDLRTHYNMADPEVVNAAMGNFSGSSTATTKVVELDFDSPVFYSEDFKLECRYSGLAKSGYERLYSIKWYKDDEEFFQYMPHDFPKVQHYNNKIITERPEYEIEPGSFRLVLKNVNLNFQGVYGCELSTEAPEFMTFKDYKPLEVYVLPNKSPRISGNKFNFLLKSRIDLNCTSPRSKPVSILQWFINDKLAPNDYQIIYQPVNHSDGLQSRTVRLRFIVNEDHYQFGQMKLECVAVYNRIGSNGSSTFLFGRHHHHHRHHSHSRKKIKMKTEADNDDGDDFRDTVGRAIGANGATAAAAAVTTTLVWMLIMVTSTTTATTATTTLLAMILSTTTI